MINKNTIYKTNILTFSIFCNYLICNILKVVFLAVLSFKND
ncbi:hypothetical protein HJ01_00218 [Flavobacterium frigoris PS1]|uniref:Uncharacterized protein n=1 Tax=Flavobacterium frigoris (strain PS1) TaxID=1086011 RepID=H7FM20_FLAFP|nr:hypothetical protein HJ01_00218 [Flavobacterium frigoris PS1]